MNLIKKTAGGCLLALVLHFAATPAYAAEPASAVDPGASVIAETISHVEQAIVEISKSDFNTAQVHLKAARTAVEKYPGDSTKVKQANAIVIQGQILTKKGEVKAATEELNKALALYKTL